MDEATLEALDLSLSQVSDKRARANLMALQVLREAARRGMKTRWELTAFDRDPATLFHIAAPAESRLPDGAADGWREQFIFGRLYWRFGGDFLMVKDRRRSDNEKVVIVLEDPWQIDRFRRWCDVTDVRTLDPQERELLDDFVKLDLALVCGNYFLMLPYRMTYWPVPNYLIS